MNSFLTRFFSAAVAVLLILVSYYFLSSTGLKLIIFLAVVIGSLELNTVLFQNTKSKSTKSLFFVFNVLIFLLSCWRPIYSGLVFAFFFVCFCVYSITVNRKFNDLNQLASYQAKAALGFFYVGLLPSFAENILDLPHGLWWFISLLSIVFAGDIGAYIIGLTLGRRKIMPEISPKKTVEGSLGGLMFSMLAGLSCSLLFPHIESWKFLMLSLATGVIGQFGDYFESLLKRVAHVKDSGGLMPGHGGVLDRIDGVLFACPIFLLGAIVLEKLI